MKKLILILTATVSLLAFPAFAQTISVSGVNSTIGSASGSFVDVQLSLSIVGTNSIGNVESINMLLKTFAMGAGLNGGGLFQITSVTPTSPFTTTNTVSSNFPSTFSATGDAANSGATVSQTTKDMGSNAPAGSSPAAASSGTTVIPFEVIRFTSLSALTAGSIFNFSVTAGGHTDAQGSWIDNTAGTLFDINSTPLFTITVVPEPGTLSLLGLGGLGSLGLSLLRRRRVDFRISSRVFDGAGLVRSRPAPCFVITKFQEKLRRKRRRVR